MNILLFVIIKKGGNMNEVIYNFITNYLRKNSIFSILLIALFFTLILFLISRALRKSGLFLLVVTFLVDKVINSLSIDLYRLYPNLILIIYISYFLGIFLFALKVFSKLLISKKINDQIKEESKNQKKTSIVSNFFRFTGALPLFVMIIINLINNYLEIFNNLIISNITSLTFLYMVFITLLHTYKLIDKINIGDDFYKVSNKKMRDLFKKDDSFNNTVNKNQGRKILRKNKDYDYINRDRNDEIKIDSKIENEKKYIVNKIDKDKFEKDISTTDLISFVTKDTDFKLNKVILSIKSLVDGVSFEYSSEKCKAKIIEDKEYKVDLEFENYNEYDYGKFLDILLQYSKDKKSYKLKLELMPFSNEKSKIVFYDPSDIFDSVKMFEGSFQGKNISMNFPKYKINFVTSN